MRSTPEALTYDPQPFGLPEARRAVVDDFRRRGLAVSRDRVVLTSVPASLTRRFQAVVRPGRRGAGARAQLPAFRYLAGLDAVQCSPLSARRPQRGRDVDVGKAATTPRTRAVVLVSPNNPTGSQFGSARNWTRLPGTAAPTIWPSSATRCSPSTWSMSTWRTTTVLAQREARRSAWEDCQRSVCPN